MKKIVIGETAIHVKWEDAYGEHNAHWTQREIDEEQPLIMHLVGICVLNNKTGITVAQEKNTTTGRYRGIHHVPKAMIRKVTILK